MTTPHIDVDVAERELLSTGYAQLGKILKRDHCLELRGMYADPDHFRSRIDMARYRFGRGEYQYFRYPLPSVVQHIRQTLYAGLAPIAVSWMSALGHADQYPADHDNFLERCRQAGQTTPTPFLLRYGRGVYNCLHEDIYGAVVFPFQVIIALSERGSEYQGGELLLVEQQPRAQSKGQAITLEQGEAFVITTRHRPVPGTRALTK